jgi:hypothetical protein
VLPFVAALLASRGVVPKWGDWVGRHAGRAADAVTPRPIPPPPQEIAPPSATSGPEPVAPDPGWGALDGAATPASPGSRLASRAARDSGAQAPIGPIRVPASAVQRAIDDGGKNIRARTARGPDGKPIGVRLTGVSGAGVGLRDGDLVIAVDGAPAMDEDAATDAALAAVARGESVLRVRLLRGDQPMDIAVELPLAPVPAGSAGKAR